jgi:hypothetical protein
MLRASSLTYAVLLLVGLAPASAETGWRNYVEPEFGTRLMFPSGILSRTEGPSPRGTGQTFKSADGRAVLAIYSQRNDDRRAKPASYVRQNFKVPRNAIDYERITPSFFAISAVHGGEIFYSRCNFSDNAGGAIHCFDRRYPERERRAWDGIVTRISLSLRPLERR